jgi:hypothetical protein
MEKEIEMSKERKRKEEMTELERVEQFMEFLQGVLPQGVHCRAPKLSEKQARDVVWFLQAVSGFIPDKYERCDVCGNIFDSVNAGSYCDDFGKNYCESHRFWDCNWCENTECDWYEE